MDENPYKSPATQGASLKKVGRTSGYRPALYFIISGVASIVFAALGSGPPMPIPNYWSNISRLGIVFIVIGMVWLLAVWPAKQRIRAQSDNDAPSELPPG
jgi:hypothetical protein